MREKGASYRRALYGAHGARVGRVEIVGMERGSSPMSPYGAPMPPLCYVRPMLCPFSSSSSSLSSFSSFSSFSSTAFSPQDFQRTSIIPSSARFLC